MRRTSFLILSFLFVVFTGCALKIKNSPEVKNVPSCSPCTQEIISNKLNDHAYDFFFTGDAKIVFSGNQVIEITILKNKITLNVEHGSYTQFSLDNPGNIVWIQILEQENTPLQINFLLPQRNDPLLNESIKLHLFIKKEDELGDVWISKKAWNMKCFYTPYMVWKEPYHKTLINTDTMTYPHLTDDLWSESLYYEGAKNGNLTSRCIIYGEQWYIIEMRSKNHQLNEQIVKSFLI